jgi:acyl-CoA thioester hydrolase
VNDVVKLDSSNCLMASERIRIPFYDIDLAGIVWHGHYLKYFELARCVLLEGIDYSYRGMKRSGFLWPVVDTQIRYVNPLVLDQEVLVTASLKEWELRLVIDYRIMDKDGILCTKGRTVQVPVEAKTNTLQLGSPEVLVKNVENCILALSQSNQPDD